jgi:hypothetical protein
MMSAVSAMTATDEDHPERKGLHVGAIVTLDLPEDAPQLSLPWIITFGPLDDTEEWEPVVCGPYERAHAISLAESTIADEDLMAVVEPLLPHTSIDEIRNEIASARSAADLEEYDEFDEDEELDEDADDVEVSVDDEFDEDVEEEPEYEEIEPGPPPSSEEVRAGFARIAAKLSAGG